MSQRLLIIDDDAWLSESYAAILKKGGYEVETVTDAEQAYVIERINAFKG